jgi:chemotaxis protein CheC
MLLDLPDGSTEALATLEVSALAEAGNVAGSAFLNVLANGSHLVILPTPPVVLEDMCGAILDTLAAELALHDQEDALVIEAQLTSAGQTVDAAFLVFPAPDMLSALAQGARDEVDGGNVDG